MNDFWTSRTKQQKILLGLGAICILVVIALIVEFADSIKAFVAVSDNFKETITNSTADSPLALAAKELYDMALKTLFYKMALVLFSIAFVAACATIASIDTNTATTYNQPSSTVINHTNNLDMQNGGNSSVAERVSPKTATGRHIYIYSNKSVADELIQSPKINMRAIDKASGAIFCNNEKIIDLASYTHSDFYKRLAMYDISATVIEAKSISDSEYKVTILIPKNTK